MCVTKNSKEALREQEVALSGYGTDKYCERAIAKIKKACGRPFCNELVHWGIGSVSAG